MVRPVVRCVLAALALPAIAGCAVPNVNTAAAGFNEITYKRQLGECYVATAGHYAWHGLGGALVGATVGAIEGATWGAIGGNAGEGAAIGAAVGSVVGLGLGAAESVKKGTASVEGCVRDKGYAINRG